MYVCMYVYMLLSWQYETYAVRGIKITSWAPSKVATTSCQRETEERELYVNLGSVQDFKEQ